MQTNKVSDSSDALISLIEVVKQNYQPVPRPVKCGKKPDYSDLSFLLLAVVAVVTKTFSDSELHRLLEQDAELFRALEFPRVPHRTTIGRRIKTLIDVAEQQISLFGKQILSEIEPDDEQVSSLSATDGRMYDASGPLWHKQDRIKDRIPLGLRNVDRESSWSKSGYRGWVQGYRLILQALCFPEPVPIFSVWRKNSRNESECLLPEIEKNRFQVTDVNLADERLSDLGLPDKYAEAGGYLLTTKELPQKRRSWKSDLFDFRKETIELLFQRIIQAFDLKECKVKGKGKNGAFVLASVWVYQICFMQNYRKHKPLAVIKEQIELARWRIKI
jgi:hypothetical protein